MFHLDAHASTEEVDGWSVLGASASPCVRIMSAVSGHGFVETVLRWLLSSCLVCVFVAALDECYAHCVWRWRSSARPVPRARRCARHRAASAVVAVRQGDSLFWFDLELFDYIQLA